jgi:hypothetical protein
VPRGCLVSSEDAEHGVGGAAGMKNEGIVATEDWNMFSIMILVIRWVYDLQ